MASVKAVFTDIITNNSWGSQETLCGAGSEVSSTRLLRAWISKDLIPGIRSLLDIGCGDFNWMQLVDLSGINYHGIDIVDALIESNTQKYEKPGIKFSCVDILAGQHLDLLDSHYDAIFLGNVVQHLPNAMLITLLDFLKTRTDRIYLINACVQTSHWQDTVVGGWRPLSSSHLPLAIYSPVQILRYKVDVDNELITINTRLMPDLEIVQRMHHEKSTQLPIIPAKTIIDADRDVCIAVLAKDGEMTLPFYLDSIYAQDYPKKKTHLYIRTNNNTDATIPIIDEWLNRHRDEYASVYYDASDVAEKVEGFANHEWNPIRFSVLGKIRQASIEYAKKHGWHYFIADADNFVVPNTISRMVSSMHPAVAPLLRCVDSAHLHYGNYHSAIDANGYYKHHPNYLDYLNYRIRGLLPQPVIHCTYFIRYEVLGQLTYVDGSGRYEYVIFADSARKSGVPQYLDNRQFYGLLTFADKKSGTKIPSRVKELMQLYPDGETAIKYLQV